MKIIKLLLIRSGKGPIRPIATSFKFGVYELYYVSGVAIIAKIRPKICMPVHINKKMFLLKCTGRHKHRRATRKNK